jgi:diamine N-acetyltransferase
VSRGVELREVTRDNLGAVLRLAVAEEQRRFVADNATSVAQAHYDDGAWMRAIYLDGEPAGFVLLEERPENAEYGLWRFMVDARFQGRGVGRRAIDLVVERVRGLPGATELWTSVVEGEGGPLGFYLALGFESTGEYDDGELVLRLPLAAAR